MVAPPFTRRALCAGLAGLALGPGRAAAEAELRVASLDIVLTEILLTLGAPPVANANNPLYRRLVGKPDLPDSVADLGPVQEPNLEYLATLAPDLVLATEWQAPVVETVRRVSPVRSISTLNPSRPPLATLRAAVTSLADVVGRTEQGRAALRGFDAAIDDARARLAGRPQAPIVICRFLEDGRNLAVFGARSMVGAVADAVGLRNVFAGRQNASGTSVAAIEDLAVAPDAVVIHFDRGAETERAMRRLAGNPLWHALPFGRSGRLVATPVVHPNGGIESARRFAAALPDALSRVPRD